MSDSSGAAIATAQRAPKHLVVVVDDDAFTRKSLQNALSQYPCRVLEAATGLDALRLITKETPDLVMLDVRMPVMSGLELLRELRATPRFRDLPVIALSGNTDRSVVMEFAELGITSFLAKPLFREALFRRLDPVFESLARGEAPLIKRQVRADDSRPNIVIADGDGNFRGFARSLLEGRLDVFEAQSGMEAYDLIVAHRPKYALIGSGLPLLGESTLAGILKSEGIATRLLLFNGAGAEESGAASPFYAVFKRTFVPDSFLNDMKQIGVLRSEASATISEILKHDVIQPVITAIQQCLGVLAGRDATQVTTEDPGSATREAVAQISLVNTQGSGQFSISLACAVSVAESLGEQILGGPTALHDGALEAMAEIVNTIGGRVREALGDCGHKFDLHFPSTGEYVASATPPDLSLLFVTNANERFVIDLRADE